MVRPKNFLFQTSWMSAIDFRYDPSELPMSFDARDKWPGKVHPVRDQGDCGASWAFSTASVASDRCGQSRRDCFTVYTWL